MVGASRRNNILNVEALSFPALILVGCVFEGVLSLYSKCSAWQSEMFIQVFICRASLENRAVTNKCGLFIPLDEVEARFDEVEFQDQEACPVLVALDGVLRPQCPDCKEGVLIPFGEEDSADQVAMKGTAQASLFF